MADLLPITENVDWILTFQNLLDEVWDDVAHRKLHISAQHLHFPECALLTDPNAVERANDGEGQAILITSRPGEVLHGELLESIGGARRGDFPLLAFVRGPSR